MAERFENGSHFNNSESYFEWWYFHFVCKGLTMNLVLHETDIFGLEKLPYASLSLLRSGNVPQYFKKPLESGSIKRNTKFLHTTTSEFEEDETSEHLTIDFVNCNLKLDISKTHRPVLVSDGVLASLNGRESIWLVQIPFASFAGELSLPGENIKVNGIAYQDHQWGNLRLQDFVSQWIWGHQSSKDESVVFFHILTQDQKIINRVIYSTPNVVQTSTSINTKALSDFKQNENFYDGTYNLNINLAEPGVKLKSNLKPNNLMRSRVSERHGSFTSTYLRWAANSTTSSKTSNRMEGLIEYLEING